MTAALRSARPATRPDDSHLTLRAAVSGLSRLVARFRTALAIRKQRVGLAKLDDHILRDMGVTRDQARAEARRGFWDVPDHWRG